MYFPLFHVIIRFFFCSVQLLSSEDHIIIKIPPRKQILMYLIITYCVIFLISNICLASIDNHPKNFIIQNEPCKNLEEICQENNDCCSDLICSRMSFYSSGC